MILNRRWNATKLINVRFWKTVCLLTKIINVLNYGTIDNMGARRYGTKRFGTM